jgi:hypothetical protein
LENKPTKLTKLETDRSKLIKESEDEARRRILVEMKRDYDARINLEELGSKYSKKPVLMCPKLLKPVGDVDVADCNKLCGKSEQIRKCFDTYVASLP